MACIPDGVRAILNTLEAGGHRAWLVGGCLRDMLLGRPVHDWDVATSARGAQVVSLFPRTVETGARFGTVTVLTAGGPVEVTTLRSDGVYSDGRRPDQVLFVDDLLEDLKRRDFTVNAMAMTGAGALSDPFDGRGDLKRRLLRCVGRPEDRFSEDALRMFRALRFSAQLGFDIEAGTMAAVGRCAGLCAALSAERVRDETEKILLSPRPALAGTAVECGLYAGRLEKGVVPREQLRRIADLPPDRQRRWSALCAVLARAGRIEDPRSFLCALRLDAKTVRSAGTGAEAALLSPLPEDRAMLKRLLSEIGPDAAWCAAAADEVLTGSDAVRRVDAVLSGGECFSLKALAVSGGDLIALGVKPGKELGALLKILLNHVIDHPEENTRTTLLNLADKLHPETQG